MEMITLLLLSLRSSASFTKIILRYFRCHSGGIAFHHPPHPTPTIIILELKTQHNTTKQNNQKYGAIHIRALNRHVT